MKLFIEEYPYKSDEAKRILGKFDSYSTKKGIATDHVGYCYDKEEKDCIFFLPKVICDADDKVFGCDPESVVDLQTSPLNPNQKTFLGNLGVWIYRALNEFYLNNPGSKIIKQGCFSEAGGHEPSKGSLLDIFLSLKKFYEENRDFFIFTMKNIHSQHHKTNWPRTISRSSMIFQDDVPVYIDPISRRKDIDWDEELMTIFFSILEYMNSFGFRMKTELNYNLIKGGMFDSYREGLGLRKLQQIKHKYYSDKTRKLWSLCNSFFEKSEEIESSKKYSDYLISSSFHTVFESMVDTLIGNPEFEDMKKLGDGKIIDHIYKDTSLFSPEEMFFIGDSKYYGVGDGPHDKSTSVFKQFSYARTIVNQHIHKNMDEPRPYRDNISEGYGFVPNFFISAETDPDLSFNVDGFDYQSNKDFPFFNFYTFENRLFDRDTLWVRQYNLNFLYLVSVYASANQNLTQAFREKARKFFRNGTIDLLNGHYEFFLLEPKSGNLCMVLTDDIKWKLRGKCYRLGADSDKMVLALEIPDPDLAGSSESNLVEDFKKTEPLVDSLFVRTRCKLTGTGEEPLVPMDESSGKFHYFSK